MRRDTSCGNHAAVLTLCYARRRRPLAQVVASGAGEAGEDGEAPRAREPLGWQGRRGVHPSPAHYFCVAPFRPRLTRTACMQAYLAFSLQADLRSTFSWNTKLLFVYLLAEYETPTNALNQVRTLRTRVNNERGADSSCGSRHSRCRCGIASSKSEGRHSSRCHLCATSTRCWTRRANRGLCGCESVSAWH